MLKKFKQNKFMLLFGATFLFAGTVLFAAGLLMYMSNQNFKKSAVQTESVITDINRYRNYNNTDSSGKYTYEVSVAFTVDGVVYEGLINEWNSGMYIGQKITVFYNPDDPWDFRTDSSLISFIFIPLGLLCMLIGAIALILMIRKNAAKKNIMESGMRVMADITDIINANVKLDNRYGKHIICEWTDEATGTIYRYKSDVIWSNPATIIERQNITQLPVYFDRNNEKNYYVDTSQILKNIKDLT